MGADVIMGLLSVAVTLAIAIGGFILRSFQRQIDEAKKEATQTGRELNDYKLQVAKEYASIAYLKDVEVRILEAISEVKKSFNEFAKEYHDNRAGR